MEEEIYTLTVKFPHDNSDEPWSRTIEVREGFSLISLHKYIQKIVEFDDDHLYKFYTAKNARTYTHNDIAKARRLNEIYPMTGVKLYYLFDFGDSWIFEIKKSRKKKIVTSDIKLPRVIDSTGENPEQYPEYD